MLLSYPESLEDFIAQVLAGRNATAKELLRQYNDQAQKTVTPQAVYKTLRKLIGQEVVLKHKDTYSLNNVWKREVVSLLGKTSALLELHPGESIMYSFKSLEQLDKYWKHIQEDTSGDVAITYFFCPHQYWWFVPGRRESEKNFYAQFAEDKRHAVLLLGGITAVDKELKAIISNPYVQVHTEIDNSFRVVDSLTVKNDLIMRTRLPLAVSNDINDIFNQNLPMEETARLLSRLFVKKIPVKILIERNAKKAEKLRKQIGKYFYIKKEVS